MRKIKLNLIFLTLLSLLFSSYSASYLDGCDLYRLNPNNFEPWTQGQTLKNITDNILQFHYDNDFQGDILFEVFTSTTSVPELDEAINLEIRFVAGESENENTFGNYIKPAFSGKPHKINIFSKHIYDYYNDTIFAGVENYKTKGYNTFLHELSHYVDLNFPNSGFGDRETIFNIEGDPISRYNVTNQQYFIDLYSDVTSGPIPVTPMLQRTIDFSWIYNISSSPYDQEDFYDETIARISAICLTSKAWNFTSFTDLNRPNPYCGNFPGLNSQDTLVFDEISVNVFEQYFLQEFPQLNYVEEDANKFCRVEETTVEVFGFTSTFLGKFVDLFTNNFVTLIALGMILSGIVGLIGVLLFKIKEFIMPRKLK